MTIQLLNMVGDGLLIVGTTMLIVSGGRADRDLPAFLVASSVSTVSALFGASILLDSLSRRRTLMAIDMVRVAAAVSIAAYLYAPVTALAVLAGLLVGLSVAVYRPALNAYIGGTVPESNRRSANALRSLSSKISSIAGPALAALLTSLGFGFLLPEIAGVLAAVSFVAFYVGPTGDRQQDGDQVQQEDRTSRFAGFRYVKSRPWILTIIAQGAIQIGLVSAPMLVIVPMWLAAHDGADQYGYVVAIEAIGATLAALALTRSGVAAPAWIAMPMLLLQAAVLLVIATGASSLWLYPSYFLLGVGMSVFGVLWIGALQDHVPDELLGRVLSIDELGNNVLSTIGLVLAGVVVAAMSLASTATVALVILVASVVAAVFVPGVVSLGQSTMRDEASTTS
ncbi:MAG: MFS transporter [Mycobacterium sp.]|nr:MFS transporter [Mycobacterium sp.]